MTVNRIILSALTLALVSAPALAQDNKAPAAAPAVTTGKPSTTGQGAAAVAAKVNLNTASAADLGKLPKMSDDELQGHRRRPHQGQVQELG